MDAACCAASQKAATKASLFRRCRFQDWRQPRDFTFHQTGQGFGSAAIRFCDLSAEISQPLLHDLFAETFVQRFRELVDDWLRCAFWHEHRIERRAIEFG